MKEKRLTNFELLRIISIILITFHHIALNTTILTSNGVNGIFAKFFVIGGKFGVNLFVLITGYFMCEKDIKISKILKIIFQVFFYSMLLMLISRLFLNDYIGIIDTLTYFFPTIFKKYWFATAYVGLCLLSPFINILISYLNKDVYKKMLMVLTMILVIIPTFTNTDIFYSDLIWFIFVYLVAAYIKLHPNVISKNRCLFISIGSYVLIFISIVLLEVMGAYFPVFAAAKYYFIGQTSFLIFISSIFTFMYFLELKSKESKIINKISSYTLGVYLIQSHPLFNKHIYSFINLITSSNYFWLVIILYVVLLFLIASILDTIIQLCFNYIWKFTCKISPSLINKKLYK